MAAKGLALTVPMERKKRNTSLSHVLGNSETPHGHKSQLLGELGADAGPVLDGAVFLSTIHRILGGIL